MSGIKYVNESPTKISGAFKGHKRGTSIILLFLVFAATIGLLSTLGKTASVLPLVYNYVDAKFFPTSEQTKVPPEPVMTLKTECSMDSHQMTISSSKSMYRSPYDTFPASGRYGTIGQPLAIIYASSDWRFYGFEDGTFGTLWYPANSLVDPEPRNFLSDCIFQVSPEKPEEKNTIVPTDVPTEVTVVPTIITLEPTVTVTIAATTVPVSAVRTCNLRSGPAGSIIGTYRSDLWTMVSNTGIDMLLQDDKKVYTWYEVKSGNNYGWVAHTCLDNVPGPATVHIERATETAIIYRNILPPSPVHGPAYVGTCGNVTYLGNGQTGWVDKGQVALMVVNSDRLPDSTIQKEFCR